MFSFSFCVFVFNLCFHFEPSGPPQDIELCVLSTFASTECVAGECLDNLMLDFHTPEGRPNLFYYYLSSVIYLRIYQVNSLICLVTPLSQA